MLEIALHESADEEFKAAIRFYESRLTGLGNTFYGRVSEALDLVLAQPFADQVVSDNYRRCLIRQFPYSIVYRVESDRIYVLAVAPLESQAGLLENTELTKNARSQNRFLRRR